MAATNFKFDALAIKAWAKRLSQRERLILVTAGLLIVAWGFERWIFSGQEQKIATYKSQIQQNELELNLLRSLSQAIADGRFSQEEDKRQLIERGTLKKQSAAIDQMIAGVQENTPQMGEIVRRLIRAQQQIQLVGLKTLPAKQIQLGTVGQQALKGPAFRHGIELEVSGQYLALVSYLERLSLNIPGLLWSDLRLTVGKYPLSTIKVTLYVLSNKPDPILG